MEPRKILTTAVSRWWDYGGFPPPPYTFPVFSTFCFKTSRSRFISETAWLLLFLTHQGSLGSRTELSSFPGSETVTNRVGRTRSGNRKRMGGRGSAEEAQGENWTQGLRAQGPGRQEPKGGVAGRLVGVTQEVAPERTLASPGGLWGVHDRKLPSSCWGPAGPWIPSITPAERGGCAGAGPRSGGPGGKRAPAPPPRHKDVKNTVSVAGRCPADSACVRPSIPQSPPCEMITVNVPVSRVGKLRRRAPRRRALGQRPQGPARRGELTRPGRQGRSAQQPEPRRRRPPPEPGFQNVQRKKSLSEITSLRRVINIRTTDESVLLSSLSRRL